VHVAGFSVWVIEVFALAVGALIAELLVTDAATTLRKKIPPLPERGMVSFGHLAEISQILQLQASAKSCQTCIRGRALSVEKRPGVRFSPL
jgi:hypothetical protein